MNLSMVMFALPLSTQTTFLWLPLYYLLDIFKGTSHVLFSPREINLHARHPVLHFLSISVRHKYYIWPSAFYMVATTSNRKHQSVYLPIVTTTTIQGNDVNKGMCYIIQELQPSNGKHPNPNTKHIGINALFNNSFDCLWEYFAGVWLIYSPPPTRHNLVIYGKLFNNLAPSSWIKIYNPNRNPPYIVYLLYVVRNNAPVNTMTPFDSRTPLVCLFP